VNWLIWLGGAVVLTILELVSLDLVLLMLAGGCLAGMVVAIATDNWVVESVVAIGVAGLMLGLVRPSLVHRLHRGPELKIGPQRLVGQLTRTVSMISVDQPGQVIIAGEQWTAQPYDESAVIAAGTTVEVLQIKGATAYVIPITLSIPSDKESAS
jgi:membrane protein implicated in regulation of membrane protease activity